MSSLSQEGPNIHHVLNLCGALSQMVQNAEPSLLLGLPTVQEFAPCTTAHQESPMEMGYSPLVWESGHPQLGSLSPCHHLQAWWGGCHGPYSPGVADAQDLGDIGRMPRAPTAGRAAQAGE